MTRWIAILICIFFPYRAQATEAQFFGIVETALVVAAISCFLPGCRGVTGPDEYGDGETPRGIRVKGGSPDNYATIDDVWNEVNKCWNTSVSTDGVQVEIRVAEVHDSRGQGGFSYNGKLVYGVRIGNQIIVADDLLALRHEFSHLVGEHARGYPVENGAGVCWL